jgi:hypothetical protein
MSIACTSLFVVVVVVVVVVGVCVGGGVLPDLVVEHYEKSMVVDCFGFFLACEGSCRGCYFYQWGLLQSAWLVPSQL